MRLFRRRGTNVIYQSEGDCKWRCHHVAANGKIDYASEQGHTRARYARQKIRAKYPKATMMQRPPLPPSVCPPKENP